MIYRFREQYGWLSNMKTANIHYKGHDFKSTENAFMWQKNPDDASWLKECLTLPPNECKKRSREISLRPDWNDVKLNVMYEVLVIKFTQEPFKTLLLETENQNIVEGNYHNDKFWGVDIKITPNEGENWLGRLIMDIRTKIKKGKL